MITSGTVAIPPTHFVRRCRNEYSNLQTALAREFLQNSIDAGASQVSFQTTPAGLTVSDNGKGIAPERMVEALLTLGGSVKDGPEAIGGYGLAKEILLFSHKSFRIRTHNTVVTGAVLAYEMASVPEFFAGAEFAIEFSPEFRYNEDEFKGVLRDYLAQCRLTVAVALNGERLPTPMSGRAIDIPFAHGRVLSRTLPSGATTSRVLVRVKGLLMFESYVSAMSKQVIVELEGDVRSLLTSNRDGFHYRHSTPFAEVMKAVTIDNSSFDRKQSQKTVFPGRVERFFGNVAALVTDTFPTLSADQVIDLRNRIVAEVANGASLSAALSSVGLRAAAAAVADLVAEQATLNMTEVKKHLALASTFDTDFVVSIEGTDFRVPPRSMRPATMTRKNRQLAQLWHHCITRVLASNDLDLAFRIGFVCDPEKVAFFQRSNDKGPGADLLINPSFFAEHKTRRGLYYAVMITAAHEVTHAAGVSYHGESFVIDSEKYLLRTLAAGQSLTHEFAAAAKVTL